MKQQLRVRVFSFLSILSLLFGALGLPTQSALAAEAGTAVQFDGTNDYVTFGSAAGLTNLGVQVFTIETWFKKTGTGVTTSTGTGGLSAAIPLVTKGRGEGDNSNLDMNYFFGIDSTTGRLAADFEECAPAMGTPCPVGASAGLNHPAFASTVIQNNIWYHAAVTFDGQNWKFYINGVQDGSTTTLPAARYPRWDSLQHAGIATAMTSTGVTAGFFHGIVDEVRIWNVVLTQAEIQANMNSELTNGTGLIARWGLNEGSGTTASSSVGTFPGTLTNGPTWVPGFPIPDSDPPAAPVGLNTTAGNTVIALSWTGNSEPDVSGYNVYRSTVSGGPYTQINVNLINGTNYTDSGLTNTTPYYYVITAVDSSSNESIYSSEVNATPSDIESALQFDGTNDYVTFGPNLNASSFTLESWVQRNPGGATMTTGSLGLDGTAGRPLAYPILTKGMGQGESPANVNMNYFLGITSTGVIGADFEDNAGGVNHPAWGSTVIPVGEWHHIAATYNGSCWALYLDGNLETLNGAVTACPSATPEFSSIQHAGLSAGIGSTGQLSTGFFAGTIDEARIWNIARTQAEIQSGRALEITSGNGLIGRWGLDEGVGQTAFNSVGTIHGTLTNGPLWVPGFPIPGNSPPVAVADAYSTPQDTPVVEAAPGVLANDTDGNNDPLTAIRVSDVTHGSLTLETNGGFTYTPTPGYTGPDSFTYKANDGTTDSSIVTVSLTVTAPAVPLVGLWEMEGNAQDSSTYANHGSLIGSPTFVAGQNGQAISLNGSQNISVPDDDSLDLTTALTIAAWIKPGAAATQDLVKKATIGGVNGFELSLASPTSAAGQKVFVRLNQLTIPSDIYRVNSETPYPANGSTWMHVAATYDGTTIKLYIDGVLENSAAGPASIVVNNLPLGIGAQSDNTRRFTGQLDDVRIEARALSDSEIADLASGPPVCYTLTLTHTGQGSNPVASPANSTGCNAGSYLSGESVSLSGAVPTTGWQIDSWTGTDDDSSTVSSNTLTMPASAHTASVNYTPIGTPPPSNGLACTVLQPKPMTASTGEKPQSKVWTHDSAWWAVFPTNASGASSTGTWLWELQGDTWLEVLKLSDSTSTKADVKVNGSVAHILLYDGTGTQLVSVEYSGGTYQPWSTRPLASPLSLSGSEIATIEIDSTGRMWLATENDSTDQIIVYHSDSPYATWNGPITLATGVADDDISAIVKLPDQIGVLWSNQTTRRFGFRLHNDADVASAWAADEMPASQSALAVGLGMADDHLNMKVASDGTIYAAVKTSYDTGGFPRVALLVRRPVGTWDDLYNVDEAGTRGILLLDEANSLLTMVYTASEGFSSIVYKQSNIPNINFSSRSTLRSGSFNDVSSTKSNYNEETVMLYSSSTEVAGQLCVPASSAIITVSGTPLSAFSSDPGVPSAVQSYMVSGSGLTGNITITAPEEFEISTSSNSGFGPSLTLTHSGGTVTQTTIYVRFNRATLGSSSGNITHVSTDALTQNVAVSGTAGSPGTVEFAAFGDYGNNSADELAVSNLVKSWTPDFIITTGDNSYDATAIDVNIGQYYSDYIGNYTGSYGTGSPTHRFFPSIGNHDYTDGGGSAAYFDYFTLPGNERYYDFVQGPVHFFVIDSNPPGTGSAPGDGRSPTSAQGAWLQAQLAASTSPWKIVYMHHPPYSSATTHGSEVDMQWPYEAWGATAVLAGHDHNYERILRDDNSDNIDLPYFTTGAGGRSLREFGTPLPGSQVRYNAAFGSMRIQASTSSITFEFWSVPSGGTLIDTYTINAVPGETLPINAGSTWKYLDNGSDQGTAWTGTTFDDSTWASGPAELGYGDGGEATVVNCGSSAPTCDANNQITTYFRKAFNVPNASIYSGLNLSLLRDDGAVVYLNGTEIWRTNMPAGAVTYTTPASTAIGGTDETTFVAPPATLANTLVDGTNVLAVEIHQSADTSSDISFDLELTGVLAGPTCYALTLGHTGNGTTPGASPANSTGCPADQYTAGQAISLSGAAPDSGWQITGWYGTGNDTSTASSNSLTMPATNHSAGVNYAASSSDVTVFFQEGASGYTGTRDTHIRQLAPTTDLGASTTVEWDGEDGSAGQASEKFGLIRFEDIFGSGAGQIPPGSTITSATLQYTVSNSTANPASSVNEAVVDWSESTTYNTFGSTAGVQPEDYGTLVTTAPASSTITYTIDVTSSLSTWSSNQASNRGWIIRPAGTDGVAIASSENSTAANRPKLTVTYANAPTTPPAAPSDLTATAQANKVHLTWTDNANNEAGFELERSITGIGGTYTPLTTRPANTVAYDDLNLTASQEYCYRVRAVNAIGPSSYAGPVCAVPLAAEALDLGVGNAYVTFGDSSALDLAQFTIETWFKRTGAGTPSSTGTSGIPNAIPLVTHGSPQADGSTVDANWVLVIDDTNDVIAADFEDMATGLNHPVYGTTAITNNVWHHAAATYDGTTWRLYLDGNLEATLLVNAAPRSDTTQHAGLGAMIESDGTPNGHFQGVLDETRVWNHARTQTDIRSGINSQITNAQTGLVARWALNDGGATVAGSAGTAVNGTITGTGYAWVTPGAPFDIVINDPPATPVLNSPANNAIGVSTSPILEAAVSDPDGGNVEVSFYGRPVSGLPAPGPDFTIIALPDTQYYTSSLNGGSPAIMESQMNWIVNNIAGRNIVFVTQLGDCTEHGDQFEIEWQNADAAFELIENPTTTGMTQGMPYGIAVGNHDQTPSGSPDGASTTFYNQYFGISRFTGRTYYGGHYGSNNDNHYQLFSASGMDFIIIHLEYDTTPSDTEGVAVLAWADNLLQTHSTRRAIVTTHHMINTGNPGSYGTQGQAIYNALKDNPNLFLLLGGHVPGEGRRSDTFSGNTVNSLLSDYQGRTNGGNGWLRIMTFSPANNTIQVQTYSPSLGTFETDADSEFTLAYDMQGAGVPYTEVGTIIVPSGSNATVSWPGLTAGTQYEWYATASDGNSTATSSTNTFTTAGQTYELTTEVDPAGGGTVNPAAGVHPYAADTVVNVSATPDNGYAFDHWSGACTGSGICQVTMDANKTVTAHFIQVTYTLDVTAVGSGTVTKNPDQVSYVSGTSVELIAAAAPGWMFSGWSGDASGTTNPLNVTMDGDKSITATFTQNTYTLDVIAAGTGTVSKNPDQASYPSGTSVELTATAAPGWTFSSWSGDASGTTNPLNVTMDGNKSITATFTQNSFTLNVATVGNGMVTKNPDQASYLSGTSVELTATAAPGWTFAGWSGSASGTTNPLNVTMDSNKSITATFTEQITYTLDITVTGGGTVSKNPDQTSYPAGAPVELTAAPEPGWTFSGWSGDATSTDNPLTVTMDGHKSVTATFAQNTYTLDVTVVGNGSVTRSSDGPYHFNDQVTLTAIPDAGWSFAEWGGDATGSANQVIVTIDGNKSVTATFVESEYMLTVLIDGNGTVARSNNGPYHLNDQVTLTASPSPGWTFSGWSGDLSSSNNPETIIVDEDKTITATFIQNTYTLDVTSTGSGTVTKDPDQSNYLSGTSVLLTATAAPGWTFTGWSGDATGNMNPLDVTMDSNKSITATFTQQITYTLGLTIVGSGTVAKNPDQTSYLSGTIVELTAIPEPGWTFTGWSGDASGSTNPLTVTMDANKNITATFAQNTYALNVTTAGSGTVTKNPDLSSYPSGTSVQLTATPEAGWTFTGWSSDASGLTNPITIIMDGNKSVTANFSSGASSIFSDGFESGNLSAWSSSTTDSGDLRVSTVAALVGGQGLQALIDDNKSIFLTDDSPNAEMSYLASFHFDPNSIPMASGDAHFIFNGFTGASTAVLRLEFRHFSGAYQLRIRMANDGSGWVNGNWITISDAVHLIELEWHAATGVGANNGSLTLSIDGAQQAELTGVDNDTRRIDRARLGAVTGVDTGTRGSYYFDEFVSGREGGGPQPTWTLTVNKTGAGSGTVTSSPTGIDCGSACSSVFNSNTVVTLTASAASGSTFTGWSGGGCSGTGTCIVTLTADISVTANFNLQSSSHALTVNKLGTGNGTVTSNPAGIDCGTTCSHSFSANTVVTLTATAASGSTFTGWSGAGCSGTGTCIVTMTASAAVTANFNLTSPADVIFANDFESGNLAAWTFSNIDSGDLSASATAALIGSQGLQALIDDNNSIFVTDDNPNAEPRYRVRFYFDPNSIVMASGDAHIIFTGLMGNSTAVLRLEFRRFSGAYQVRVRVINDGSTWTNTNWFTISDASHAIELDWRAATAAGANNGGLTLWIDGVQQADLTGVDNDTRRIDRVRLGVVTGMDTGTRGTYYFDAFESRRLNYVGP